MMRWHMELQGWIWGFNSYYYHDPQLMFSRLLHSGGWKDPQGNFWTLLEEITVLTWTP